MVILSDARGAEDLPLDERSQHHHAAAHYQMHQRGHPTYRHSDESRREVVDPLPIASIHRHFQSVNESCLAVGDQLMRFAGGNTGLLTREFNRSRHPTDVVDETSRFGRGSAPDASTRQILRRLGVQLATLGDLAGEIRIEMTDNAVELT